MTILSRYEKQIKQDVIRPYTQSQYEIQVIDLQQHQQAALEALQQQQSAPPIQQQFQQPFANSQQVQQKTSQFLPFKNAEPVSIPLFTAQPLLLNFLKISTKINTQDPGEEAKKQIGRSKRISSLDNISVINSLFPIIKTLNSSQLFELTLIFWDTYFNGSRNLVTESASIQAKMQVLPILINKLTTEFNFNVVNLIFAYLLKHTPVIVGGYRQCSQNNIQGSCAMFWMAIFTVKGISATALYQQISKSWMWVLEDIDKKQPVIAGQNERSQILQCMQGVIFFIKNQQQGIDKQLLLNAFNYNPFHAQNLPQANNFLDFFSVIFQGLDEKAQYNYMREDIQQL
ncbi:hypothetical protein SS50377_25470 [Spironucleus salmonicida]|uniref:Uncharacterized protein n=1 Tax=Spironucleus salmonicida TaxID=348837 RepID=V6LKX6_9EUKA|nr:hypothetical protein SS50377_25470 [Spironucleus salmonicida]|eukprot:EST45018.1 Hypothetical protein SS50377_15037 [Spironucleus salmonicida]